MNRKNFLLALPLAAYFALLADLPHVFERTVFYAFQSRDLTRAFELLNGRPIFYGPEMTGGGNLPGPLYYFLLAPALLFGNNWENAWLEMVLLAACAGVIAWWYFRSNGLKLAALLACTLIALSVYTQHFFSIFINPSYQFILLIPALIMICRAFDPALNEKQRGRSFVAAAFTVGLSLQLHFSIAFLVPAMITLQILHKPLALPQVRWRYFWRAGLALPIASIPFLIWLAFNRQPGQEWNNFGEARDVVPTLLYLLKAINNIPLADVLQIFSYHLVAGVCPILLILAVALIANQILRPHASHDWNKQDEERRSRGLSLAKPLAVCAMFGFVPFSYIAVVPIANRYGLTMFVSLTLLTALLQESLLTSRLRQYCFNTVAAAVVLILSILIFFNTSGQDWPWLALLVTAGLIAVLLTYLHSKTPIARATGFLLSLMLVLLQREGYRAGFFHTEAHSMVMIRQEQWRMAWTDIYRHTGWSLDQVKGRVFFINAHLDGDPEPMYRTVMKAEGPIALNTNAPDGYFVIVNPPNKQDVRTWMQNVAIPVELREGLRTGDIELGDIGWNGVWTIPYRVRPDSPLPKNFHNWALYYNSAPQPNPLAETEPDTAVKIEDRYIFKWNECPDRSRYCDNGAVVRINKQRDGVDLHVEVKGESLSQNSPWIHPKWTQAWNRPFVEINCGGTKHTLELASSIGFKREYMDYQPVTTYFVANNSLLAPFERRFRIPCKEDVQSIAVGRESSTVDHLRSSITLPARKLTVQL